MDGKKSELARRKRKLIISQKRESKRSHSTVCNHLSSATDENKIPNASQQHFPISNIRFPNRVPLSTLSNGISFYLHLKYFFIHSICLSSSLMESMLMFIVNFLNQGIHHVVILQHLSLEFIMLEKRLLLGEEGPILQLLHHLNILVLIN